jgi:hypothetical protein
MSCVFHGSPEGWLEVGLPARGVLAGSRFQAAELSVVAFGAGAGRRAALVVRPGVAARVNGRPVPGGLRVLAHQDEISLSGKRLFFSTHSRPRVVTFRLAAGQKRPRCGRCRGLLEDGQDSVCCPGCSRWFHQLPASGDRPAKHCFTYDARCLCSHPTSLEEDGLWQPEEDGGDR